MSIELREDKGVGEEDRVVAEGLRAHEGDAEDGALAVVAEEDADACAEPAALVAAQAEGAGFGGREGLAGFGGDAGLELGDDLVGFLGAAVGHEPAGRFRDEAAEEEDDEADDAADDEGESPAVFGVDDVGVEDDDGADCAQGCAEPVAAVDDEVGEAPAPGRDEFLDGGVDGGVFTADAEAGDEAEGHEGGEVPGEAAGGGGDEVDEDGDGEELLAAEAVGEPAEEEGADDGAGEVGAGGCAELGLGEVEAGGGRDGAGEGADEGDLEAVEDPGYAEGCDDEGVEAAPWEAVEALGDVRLEGVAAAGHQVLACSSSGGVSQGR